MIFIYGLITTIMLIVMTIRALPFINIEAAINFQNWVLNVQRSIEDKLYQLDRKEKSKN